LDLVNRAPVRPTLAWPTLVLLAVVGTVLGVVICLVNLQATEKLDGGLIHTGPSGPAAALLRREMPHDPQFSRGEHDGPMYYAIARDPFHLEQTSRYLDRPRYRLQHPLLSWLGWAAHPWGGGQPMVWTLFGVTVVAVFLGSVAMGALSQTLRGPPWPALLFGLLPGVIMSLRITTGDALGVALLLIALVASMRGHLVVTALAAVAAVLAKEPMLVPLIGVALWRRDRDGLALVVPPIVVSGLWWLWLRIQLGAGGEGIVEFGLPFAGLKRSLPIWYHGDGNIAALSFVLAVGLAVAALVRSGWRHPLGLALIGQLCLTSLYTASVIGLDRNGTRMTLPLCALAIVMAVTPKATKALANPASRTAQRPASAATTGANVSSASTPSPM
jgi:hypothetical protein